MDFGHAKILGAMFLSQSLLLSIPYLMIHNTYAYAYHIIFIYKIINVIVILTTQVMIKCPLQPILNQHIQGVQEMVIMHKFYYIIIMYILPMWLCLDNIICWGTKISMIEDFSSSMDNFEIWPSLILNTLGGSNDSRNKFSRKLSWKALISAIFFP